MKTFSLIWRNMNDKHFKIYMGVITVLLILVGSLFGFIVNGMADDLKGKIDRSTHDTEMEQFKELIEAKMDVYIQVNRSEHESIVKSLDEIKEMVKEIHKNGNGH